MLIIITTIINNVVTITNIVVIKLLYLITLGSQSRQKPAIVFTGKPLSSARLDGVDLNSRFLVVTCRRVQGT